MLACRPTLSFASAVMAGAALARLRPEIASLLHIGWLVFAALAAWFLLTPEPEPPTPEGLPDGYAAHIVPRPGFLARRGLNRFILVAGLGLLLVGAWRQISWERSLSLDRLPENRWFDATFLALTPRREYGGEKGVWRVPALLLTADGEPAPPIRVRLSGPDGRDFRRGDRIAARVRRDPDSPKPYPGAFDFRLWMERDGMAASLAVAAPRRSAAKRDYAVIPIDDVSPLVRIRRAIDVAREAGIRRTLQYGGPQGPVLAAMIYGYRKDLDADLRDVFRRTGIGHVLAISGLHVGLIVGLLWWTSGWLGWPSRRRAVSCLVLAVVYLGLAGVQIAAARATVMAVIHLGGIALGRRGDMLNSLGAAAFLLTLINPSSPMDISFQLSFTAVVFIYLGLRGGGQRGRGLPSHAGMGPPTFAARIRKETWSLTRLSVATWFGLLPIVAQAFNQINLVGLPINILVIPFMSLVLACGLLLPILGWIPGVDRLLQLPSLILAHLAAAADRLPYSSIPAHSPSTAWIVVFYLSVAALLLRGTIKDEVLFRRWSVGSGVVTAAAFVGMAASMASSPPPEKGRIAFLPGRGLGMIVAESPEGGIALVGTISRGGIDAAGWLHHLRRDGEVAVIAVGETVKQDLSSLSYHCRLASLANEPENLPSLGGRVEWREAAGAPGVGIAVSRDARGKIAWLAVKAGRRSVCVTPRIAVRQFTWRLENRIPGFDADLLVANFSDRDVRMPLAVMPRGWMALGGWRVEPLTGRWFSRSAFGAVVVEEGAIRGFDGENWKTVDSDSPPGTVRPDPAPQ